MRHQCDEPTTALLPASNALTLLMLPEERSSCKSDADDSPFVSDTHTLIINDKSNRAPYFLPHICPSLTLLTHQQQPQSQPTLPPSQALQSASSGTISASRTPPSQHPSSESRVDRQPTYLHTRAHRIRWRNPLRPNRIYLAKLLDIDDVDPPAHDLVEAGVCGSEAGLDVAHCLMLDGYQLFRLQRALEACVDK